MTQKLFRLNIGAAILHFVQAIAVLVLANDFALPVTSFFWNDAPNNDMDIARLDRVFDVSIAWAAALFLFLSALFHLIVATVGRKTYENELSKEQNRFRWVEYSISSTVMISPRRCVMKIMEIPLSAKARMAFNKISASLSVKTAVGSSKTKILVSKQPISLAISVNCL